jgi:sortase (surface protein transpeptidase)
MEWATVRRELPGYGIIVISLMHRFDQKKDITQMTATLSRLSLSLRLALLLSLILVLAGCQLGAGQRVQATPAPDVAEAAAPTPAVAEEAMPAVAEGPQPPASLTIAEAEMVEIPVVAMGWRVTEVDGVRTTMWEIPGDAAGWHPDSGLAGQPGNVIISGHQLLGIAPFAAIALGDVLPGQEVLLTDAAGNTFSYVVREVTDPLPIEIDAAAEQILANTYLAQGEEAILTLISGWPDFSTTHRVLVIADLVESAD